MFESISSCDRHVHPGDPPSRLLASSRYLALRRFLLVPSPSLPLLRRLGGSFLLGALVGMLWALLVIHRRPRLLSGAG
jgi:hypothetical protein